MRASVSSIAAFVLACSWFACGTEKDAQRGRAEALRPAALEEARPELARAPGRALRVRIYVDRDYREQTLRWDSAIDAQIDRANRVLEPALGVRLTVESVRNWERTGHHDSLDTVLTQLIAKDAGRDVDWVFGFTSSLQMVSATQENLGLAELPGRHLVVRGMFSLGEYELIRNELDKLPASERDTLAHELKLHKETVVLLHEWAHTLGAPHESGDSTMLAALYDKRQSAFSDEAIEIMKLGLAARGATDPAAQRAWARAYKDELEKTPRAWEPASFAESVRFADRILDAGSPPPTQSTSEGSAVHDGLCSAATRATAQRADPKAKAALEACLRMRARVALPADSRGVTPEKERAYAELVARALGEIQAGDAVQGALVVESVRAAFPDSPAPAMLSCFLDGRARDLSRAAADCAAVAAAVPENALATYVLGLAAAEQKDLDRARDLFLRTLALDDTHDDVWASLAFLARAQGDRALLNDLQRRHKQRFGAPVKPALWPPGWIAREMKPRQE